MSPPSDSPNSKITSKKKKQRKERDSIEILTAAAATTSKPDKKRKKIPPELEDDHGITDHKETNNLNGKDNGDGKIKKKKQRSREQYGGEKESGEKRRGGGEGGGSNLITDPRFASAHRDPRFQRMPRRHSMVEVDSRFADAFKDERFALTTAPVDKRGKVRRGKQRSSMLRYYIQEKEPGVEEAEEEKDAVRRGLLALDHDEEDFGESESGSSSSSSSSDDEDEDDDQHSVGSDVAHYLMANHDDTPQTDQATQRLAVVNMDWDHIKATDIYVVMRSCLPKDGHILSVAIYPSEFGLKCMEIEATRGPSALIIGNEEHDGNDTEDSDIDVDNEKENEKLRSYELSRFRYYYAVIDCDSSSTANHLYEALDGTELLKTSNVFDLRFIPDSMEFLHPARDVATESPANYKEPDFHTRALQHSNVKLSWEEDEPKRKKILRRKFNADQLDDMELKDFLASDEDSDEDEDTEDGDPVKLKQVEKYRTLLQSVDESDAEEVNDQDMEITFNTGLEDIAKRALEKKDHKSETVWEAYLKRRKEKRKSKKKISKYSSDDDDHSNSDGDFQQASGVQDQYDDFFEEEPSDNEIDVRNGKKGNADLSPIGSKKNKKDKKQSESLHKEQEASQAELELLCTNVDSSENPSEEEDELPKKVKKKGKKQIADNKLPKGDFRDDPRFSVMFTSHLYALDPTDPQFKRSATYARQIIRKQKHTNQDEQASILSEPAQPPLEASIVNKIDGALQHDISPRKEQAEFLSVVRSLKRRTEALKSGKKGK